MNKNKLAFIFHPLNSETARVITEKSSAFSVDSDPGKDSKKNFDLGKPFVFSELCNLVSTQQVSIDFISIVCPLLPEQLITSKEKSIEKVLESLRLAEDHGCNLAVLAGFTSIATNQGKDLIGKTKITFTTGNTYTAALAVSSIYKACEILGYRISDLKCAIIGAGGDIGKACAKALISEASSLSLCIRDASNAGEVLSNLPLEFKNKVEIYKKVDDALSDSDVVISATSALTTIINPAKLKAGAIICDVALPPNIAREISGYRNDLLVYEGGLSAIPSFEIISNSSWNFWWHRNAIYGCLAEGMILSYANQLDSFSIGRGQISIEKMNYISALGSKYGFQNSEFFCGDFIYQKEDFIRIAKAHNVANQVCIEK
jgi:predicted amino acid dehydrogenase